MSSSSAAFDESHAIKCELASEVLNRSGSLRLKVMGWSMLPAVWPGDTLVIERIRKEDVVNGDIVLFNRDRRLFAHRVVSSSSAGDLTVLTRGDAMPAPDPLVPGSDPLGKVSFIIRNGKCIEPSKSLRLSQRAVSAVFQRSEIAARLVVGIHGLRQNSQNQASQLQASNVQSSQL
jgi:signal peptidase I